MENTNKDRHSYMQASLSDIKDILKIKENFSNLFLKKIHQTINKPRKKSHINMTTKSLLRRQIIVLIGKDNISKFILESSKHITNINRTFKNIMVNFVCTDHYELLITTNKVKSPSNFSTIKEYIKNVNNIVS